MTQLLDSPPRPARRRLVVVPAIRPDYDEVRPAPLLGWLIAVPCGIALWAAIWWTVTVLLH